MFGTTCACCDRTMVKINHLVIVAGHKPVPEAMEAVAADLAKLHGGWRQHEHVLQNVKKIVDRDERV